MKEPTKNILTQEDIRKDLLFELRCFNKSLLIAFIPLSLVCVLIGSFFKWYIFVPVLTLFFAAWAFFAYRWVRKRKFYTEGTLLIKQATLTDIREVYQVRGNDADFKILFYFLTNDGAMYKVAVGQSTKELSSVDDTFYLVFDDTRGKHIARFYNQKYYTIP